MRNAKMYAVGVALVVTMIGSANNAEAQYRYRRPMVPISQFAEVEPGLYRGAEPDMEGMRALKKLGVRTIVDLRTTSWDIEDEAGMAQDLQIRYVSVPIGSFSTPRDRDVERIEAMMSDPSLRPLFIHCRHGEDRTGLMVGLYRVFVHRWTPEKAYDEMLRFNFHTILWGLSDYFYDKTGWRPENYVAPENRERPRWNPPSGGF